MCGGWRGIVRNAKFTHGRGDIEQNGREEESEAQCRQGQQGCSERRPLSQLIPPSSPCPCAWRRKNAHANANSQRSRGRRHSAAAARRKSTTTATTTTAADGGHTRHRRRSRRRRRLLPLPWLVPAATTSTATGAVDDTDTIVCRRQRGHLHDRRRSPPSVRAAVAGITVVAGRPHEQPHHRGEGGKEVLVRWPG